MYSVLSKNLSSDKIFPSRKYKSIITEDIIENVGGECGIDTNMSSSQCVVMT